MHYCTSQYVRILEYDQLSPLLRGNWSDIGVVILKILSVEPYNNVIYSLKFNITYYTNYKTGTEKNKKWWQIMKIDAMSPFDACLSARPQIIT
jgi:hypothetical protein